MRARRGFSALELVVGLFLLAVAVAGLKTMGSLGRSTPEITSTEIERLADDRLDTILTDPRYDALEERYRGIELRLDGVGGVTRVTNVVHWRDSTDAGVVDFKRISVTITGPAIEEPLVRTATVTRAWAGRPAVHSGVPGS